MSTKNIHANTQASGPCPAYVSINEQNRADVEASYTMTVRGTNGSHGIIHMNADELRDMATDILSKVGAA